MWSAPDISHRARTRSLREWEVTPSAKPLTEGILLIRIAWFKLIRMDMDAVKRKTDRLSLRNPQGRRSAEIAAQLLIARQDPQQAAHGGVSSSFWHT